MTDWWNASPVHQGDDAERAEWRRQAHEDMDRITRAGEDLSREPDDWGYGGEGGAVLRDSPHAPAPEAEKPDRRKGLLLGAAGAAAAGILVFTMMPDDSPATPEKTSVAQQGDFLPPAGAGPSEVVQDPSAAPSGKVTVTMSPDGFGSVGAIVKLVVHNGTDESVMLMSSMVKGDGQSAVIGEGTLAPGSRRVKPGETVTGTVEFAAKGAPSQVVLFGIGGNVVAVSE